MKYDIRGDKLVVTNAIKEYAEEKVSKIEKYLASSDEIMARIVVSVKGKDQKVEVTIPTKNLTLRAEEKSNDLLYKGKSESFEGIGELLACMNRLKGEL